MPDRTIATHGPHPVDVHVGRRLKLRRTMLGMSTQQVAGHLGLTFQQIQKYSTGANRISASRLYEIARILDVPVSFFFDDMPKDIREEKEVAPEVAYHGHRADRASLELMRHFPELSAGIRQAILTIARESAQEKTVTMLPVTETTADDLRELIVGDAN